MKEFKQKLTISAAFVAALILSYHPVLFARESEAKIHGTLAVNGVPTQQFPSLAKINSQEAVTIAQQAYKGSIISVGLENEDGFLIYAVNVAGSTQGVHEILVDAGNGKILADQSKGSGHKEENDEEEDD